MENYLITTLEVSLKEEVLDSIKSVPELRQYLRDVVSPVICDAVQSVPKGGEINGSIGCSTDRGCEVRVGGTIHF